MRTRRVRLLGMVAVLVLLAVACNGPWASPHAGPDQSGYNASENVIGVGNVATLTQKYSLSGAAAVIDNQKVFVDTGMQVSAYPVGSMGRLWFGALPAKLGGAPVVADGRVFAMTRSTDNGQLVSVALEAFDATRTTPCGDVPFEPQACPPLWQAPTGNDFASPTVVGGVVYVVGRLNGTQQLQAYDASGTTGCSGSPKVCTPLWTAPMSSVASPAVVDGRVYADNLYGGVSVFDAAGTTGCSGSPKVCTPLFTTTTGYQSNFLAVVGGRIVRFNGSDTPLLSVFDAAGSENCTGTPTVCSPLWTASAPALGLFATPAIAGGAIYLPTSTGVQVYDLAGVSGCSGSPKVCTPLRTIDLNNPATPAQVDYDTFSGVSIANGVGYVGNNAGDLVAFDARSVTGCSGTPLRCPQLWRTHLGSNQILTTPAIANGSIYVTTGDYVVHVLAPAG